MSILIMCSEMEQNLLRVQGIQWFNCEISWIQKFRYHLTSVCVCSVAQLCLTLLDPMNRSPPGSSVHRDSPGKNTGVGCHVLLQEIFPTQVSQIAGRFFTEKKKKSFFNQKKKKKLPCPPPGDLSNLGMELGFPALQANSLPAELPGSPYCNLSTHKISRKINYNIKEEKRNYLYVL